MWYAFIHSDDISWIGLDWIRDGPMVFEESGWGSVGAGERKNHVIETEYTTRVYRPSTLITDMYARQSLW